MEQKTKTRECILSHSQSYPLLQIQDMFKFLYQSSFGCEHMIADAKSVIEWIRKEMENVAGNEPASIEPLDGAYSRVPLTYRNMGLSAETLGNLFCASAKHEPSGRVKLEEKLAVAEELVHAHALPFSPEAFKGALNAWRSEEYPSVHHSECYREHYHPAYRVIANQYVSFLPLFAEIDKRIKTDEVVMAIDGGSASGKTTLSEIIEQIYDCTVFHMDDFFLRSEQRTPERYAQVGGNVDRERFENEVLIPLREHKSVCYRKFDCSTFTLKPPTEVNPKRLTVIEGAYSMHPALSGYYDFKVFLDITPVFQRTRILKRNSTEMAERFFSEWIPLETRYFQEMMVKERCDLTIPILQESD